MFRTPAIAQAVLCMLLAGACRQTVPRGTIVVRDTEPGTDELLIGLSSAGGGVAWVSGTGGTFGRSIDGGQTWTYSTVPGADSLEFRDVHAVDSTTAFLLSAGSGSQSRIYKTSDAGSSWELQWTNSESEGFFDCFDFWSPVAGLAMGDAVDGRIMLIRTQDGRRWSEVDSLLVPRAAPGEGGFASSGTCLVINGDSTAWVATGSASGSRVYRTSNRGEGWHVATVPFVSGATAAGIMSLSVSGERTVFAAGGALSEPDEPADNFAVSVDGGATWQLRGHPQLPNVYSLAAHEEAGQALIIAVGPKGMDASFDGGESWISVDKRNYWGVRFVEGSTAIAVGPRGRVSQVTVER